MTFARLRNGLAGLALVAATACSAHAGEQGVVDGRARTTEQRAAATSMAADPLRPEAKPAGPLVSVAVSVLDLNALSAAAFGDHDESAP